MSGKRTKLQLTREEAYREESSDDNEQPAAQAKASAETMSKRKIATFGKRFQPKLNNNGNDIGNNNSSTNSTVNGNVNLKDNDDLSIKLAQLKSLNANFLKSINDSINKNPVADFTLTVNKYLEYYNKIQSNKIEVRKLDVPKVEVKPIETDSLTPFSFTSAENHTKGKSTEDEFKNSGAFSFLAKPKSTEPAKSEELETIEIDVNSEKSDSDGDDEKKEIKIQGPAFKIDSLPKSKDYTLKFGYVPPKDDDDSDDDIRIEGPSFKTDVKVVDSVFKFPTKNDEKKPVSQSVGGFTFNAPKKEEVKEEDKPVGGFTSGAPKIEENKDSKPTASSFSFGSTIANSTTDAKPSPTFGFGSNSSFNFKPSETKAENSTTSSSFKFNSSALSALPKAEETKEVPKFNFGSTSSFNFGSTPANTAENKSAFSFGSTTSAGPSSSTATNPFNLSSNTSSLSAQPAFNFSVPAPSKNEDKDKIDDEADKSAENDNVKGDFALVKLTEKIETKTGEEDEETIYTKRSKASKFDLENKSYITVGVGELKILTNKKSGKSRIVIRSDGSLNVLLNTYILKDVNYELIGAKQNILRFPTVTENGLETFIAQVKTGADGAEFLEKVKSCQH